MAPRSLTQHPPTPPQPPGVPPPPLPPSYPYDHSPPSSSSPRVPLRHASPSRRLHAVPSSDSTPPPSSSSSSSQSNLRPPFPKPPTRQGFPDTPPNFPPPLYLKTLTTLHDATSALPMPPPMSSPQSVNYPPPYYPPHPPFPPPQFNPAYAQSQCPPAKQDPNFRHFKYDKQQEGGRRSPERGYAGTRSKGRGVTEVTERTGTKRRSTGEETGRREGESRRRGERAAGGTGSRTTTEDAARPDTGAETGAERDIVTETVAGHRLQTDTETTQKPFFSRDRKRADGKERDRNPTAPPQRPRPLFLRPQPRLRRTTEREAGEERERRKRERGRRKKIGRSCSNRPGSAALTRKLLLQRPMDQVGDSTVVGTSKLRNLFERFEEELGRDKSEPNRPGPNGEPPKTKLDEDHEGSSSESECESDAEGSSCSSSSDSEVFDVIAEIKRKKAHPDRLHEELWYNDPGQMNDGPLCKCSAKARRTGIRHSIYPGEEVRADTIYHLQTTFTPRAGPTFYPEPNNLTSLGTV
ncbi:hypothetical protein WMY93_029689 [Mugilogobius chulae]|uniref:Uncharacterized protein n=1 Tax=Mugilogobius chulae TaxID=88201 RepID=A0AAW0MLR1_9GOBI